MNYHCLRESLTSGMIKMSHIPEKYNPYDILTNPLDPQ